MSAPIYFFAHKSRGDVVRDDRLLPSLLAETGLDTVLDGVRSVERECFCQDLSTKGPGGQSGVLLCVFPPDGAAPKRLGFYPDFQEWLPAIAGKLWIGLDREEPPRPRDLVRTGGGRDVDGVPKPPHPGRPLAMGPQGEQWTVPVIRRPAIVERYGVATTKLPRDLGWDLEGKFVETVQEQYREIWEDTAVIADMFFDDAGALREGEFEMSVELGLKTALRALALNYRVGRHEQNRLKLVNDRNIYVLLGLTVDFLLVKELIGQREKKSLPAPPSASTPAGPPAGSPTTNPAAESSG